MQAESILQELTRKVVEKEEGLHQDMEHVADHDSEEEGLSSEFSDFISIPFTRSVLFF